MLKLLLLFALCCAAAGRLISSRTNSAVPLQMCLVQSRTALHPLQDSSSCSLASICGRSHLARCRDSTECDGTVGTGLDHAICRLAEVPQLVFPRAFLLEYGLPSCAHEGKRHLTFPATAPRSDLTPMSKSFDLSDPCPILKP